MTHFFGAANWQVFFGYNNFYEFLMGTKFEKSVGICRLFCLPEFRKNF
jgi:hypothetical protein